jgi:hypothetical protein
MGIGDNILLVSCLAGLMLALPSLLIFLNLALIGTSNRATARLSTGGCVPFGIGVVISVVVGVPAAILLSIGSVPQAIGAILSLLLLFFGFVGLAVVARLVGQRLVSMDERDESPLVQTVTGSLILSFSIAFPLLGWFIILPFSLLTGLGAVVIAMVAGFGSNFRRPKQQPVPAPGPMPAPPAPVAYNYDYEYDQAQ